MNLILDKLKQYPLAVVCGVGFLVSVCVLFFRSSVLAELSAKEAELDSRIRVMDQNAKASKDLDQQLAILQEHVASIDERLFERSERAINTNFFYAFEGQIDVVISSVSQLTTEDPALVKGGPNELKLHSAILYDLIVKGTFQDILGFIYELYRVEPLIRVTDIKMDKVDGTDAELAGLVANMRVAVLSRKDETGK